MPKINIDEALDKPGFRQFLAQFPGAEHMDMTDETLIGSRFELFTATEEVKQSLRELYGGNIQQEMGIAFGDTEEALLNDHWDKQALKHPEAVIEMRHKLEQFQNLPDEIADLQTELQSLRGVDTIHRELGQMRDEAYMFALARSRMGFSGFIHMLVNFRNQAPARAAEQRVWEKHGTVTRDQVDDLLSETQKKVTDLENEMQQAYEKHTSLIDAQERFVALRKELLGGLGQVEYMAGSLQARIKVELELLTDDQASFEDMSNAQDQLAVLKETQRTTETGINPLATMNADFEKNLNEDLEIEAEDRILRKIREADVGALDAFDALEGELAVIIDMPKIGSKSGIEAARFVMDVLAAALKEIQDAATGRTKTPEEIIKIMMIKRILGKVRIKAETAVAATAPTV